VVVARRAKYKGSCYQTRTPSGEANEYMSHRGVFVGNGGWSEGVLLGSRREVVTALI